MNLVEKKRIRAAVLVIAVLSVGFFLWQGQKQAELLPISVIENYKLYCLNVVEYDMWCNPPYQEVQDEELRRLLFNLCETLTPIDLSDEVKKQMGPFVGGPADIILRGEEISYYICTSGMSGNPSISNIWIGKAKNKPEPDIYGHGGVDGKYCRMYDMARHELVLYLEKQYGFDVLY